MTLARCYGTRAKGRSARAIPARTGPPAINCHGSGNTRRPSAMRLVAPSPPVVRWYASRNAGAAWWSQDDDPTPRGFASGGECAEHIARARGQHLSQTRAEGSEGSSVRPRFCHEKYQAAARVVADLQRQLTFQGLTVRDPRLGLDARPPWPRFAPADFCVPCAQVALAREGDLRTPPKAAVKTRSKAFEQGKLGAIADGVAGWIRADREIEPEHREPGAKVSEVESLDVTSLEAPQLWVRRPGRRSTGAQAQPRAGPRLAVLSTQASQRVPRPSPAPIGRPLSSCHRLTVWTPALHGQCTARYASRTKGHQVRRLRDLGRPAAVGWSGRRNAWRLI